jgi:hypothetical protein
MAIVESFKHWRHYLEGTQHTIEVWSDHQNLQGFMRQPKINGRQARWLVYLTPYDFVIKHRPGLLNPADGPSRRPDYVATAQKEPSQLHKDLLAAKLVDSESSLPQAEELCDTAVPRLDQSDRLAQPYDSGRPRLEQSDGRFLRSLPLHRRGLPTPARSNWVGATDSKADHLLHLARIQTVTRKEARAATLGENPSECETADTLLTKIHELQQTDPLCRRLRKEISTKISTKSQQGMSTTSGQEGYSIGRNGLLFYKGRVVVPAQKALTQELLYLYHDDQFSGH